MRVTVVGSGVVGVTSAYFLARAGHEVTVLDRAADLALGTSHANAGMLTPSMADPWNSPGVFRHLLAWLGREDAPFLLRPRALPSMALWGLAFVAQSFPSRFHRNMERNLRLASYSMTVLRELRASLALSYDGSARGTIKVFGDHRAFDEARVRNELLAGFGLDVRAVTPDEAVALEPALAPVRGRLVGGIYCPEDEAGDAAAFTRALGRHARDAGVRFEFGVDVIGCDAGGRRLTAVRTAQGARPCDAVVIAAGTWSPALLDGLGVNLPVRPVKGYSITVPIGDWPSPPRMPVIDGALHAAATPLGRRLRVAGTAELAGYDVSLSPGRIDNLFRMLLELFPSYAPHLDRANAQPWAGLRPVAADGVPRIGRAKFENLYVNSGHGHLGWTLACGSARLLADLVSGRAPEVDAAAYAP